MVDLRNTLQMTDRSTEPRVEPAFPGFSNQAAAIFGFPDKVIE
jgi:hypothetical protein